MTELYNSKKPIFIEVATIERTISKTKGDMREIENVTKEINADVVKSREDFIDIEAKGCKFQRFKVLLNGTESPIYKFTEGS